MTHPTLERLVDAFRRAALEVYVARYFGESQAIVDELILLEAAARQALVAHYQEGRE